MRLFHGRAFKSYWDEVFVLSMTNGASPGDLATRDDVVVRIAASNNGAEILRFVWAKSYHFSDNALDSYPLIEWCQLHRKCNKSV